MKCFHIYSIILFIMDSFTHPILCRLIGEREKLLHRYVDTACGRASSKHPMDSPTFKLRSWNHGIQHGFRMFVQFFSKLVPNTMDHGVACSQFHSQSAEISLPYSVGKDLRLHLAVVVDGGLLAFEEFGAALQFTPEVRTGDAVIRPIRKSLNRLVLRAVDGDFVREWHGKPRGVPTHSANPRCPVSDCPEVEFRRLLAKRRALRTKS
mmetsp:Transcript_9453/g.13005  ORF Transcript_9453/g.13005 Transcript_9453/m.13005 type:complete len:208 (+) Transcript_9453:331-954(+)